MNKYRTYPGLLFKFTYTYILTTKCRAKPFDLKPKVQYEHLVSRGQFTGFYYSGWIPEQSGLNLGLVVLWTASARCLLIMVSFFQSFCLSLVYSSHIHCLRFNIWRYWTTRSSPLCTLWSISVVYNLLWCIVWFEIYIRCIIKKMLK